METKRKVLAYITRGEENNRELLVFERKNHAELGLEVPGGTIEKDELIIDALYREIEEETGISREQLELQGKVNKTNYFPKDKDTVYERTIFHLAHIAESQDAWEHEVQGDGSDQGRVFSIRFVPLEQLPHLARNQDQAIPLII